MQPSRLYFCLVGLLVVGVPARGAEDPLPLLQEAVQKWNAGKEDLAFTQRIRTFDDDGKVKEERVERYDPSLPDERRWHLVEVNGKPPTDAQRERLEARKNRRPRKGANKPLGEYFEFEHAKVIGRDHGFVRYDVPVRSDVSLLIDLEKLDVVFSVNEATKTIEHVSAGLRQPMRIALGLVRVTDVDLDVHFDANSEIAKPPPPPPEQKGSSAHVVVSKLGDRSEYTWSDFKRVVPHPSPSSE